MQRMSGQTQLAEKITTSRIYQKLEFGMDARAHTSTSAECAPRYFDASFSGVCRPKFTKLGTRVEQPCALNKFILELRYSAAFGRESKGDRKYAKFRHFLAHRVV